MKFLQKPWLVNLSYLKISIKVCYPHLLRFLKSSKESYNVALLIWLEEKTQGNDLFAHICSQPLIWLVLFSKLKAAKIIAVISEKRLTSMLQKSVWSISNLSDKFILDHNTAFCTPYSFGNHRISNIALSSSPMCSLWSYLPIAIRAGWWLRERYLGEDFNSGGKPQNK